MASNRTRGRNNTYGVVDKKSEDSGRGYSGILVPLEGHCEYQEIRMSSIMSQIKKKTMKPNVGRKRLSNNIPTKYKPTHCLD